jgi:hypothetical protein
MKARVTDNVIKDRVYHGFHIGQIVEYDVDDIEDNHVRCWNESGMIGQHIYLKHLETIEE